MKMKNNDWSTRYIETKRESLRVKDNQIDELQLEGIRLLRVVPHENSFVCPFVYSFVFVRSLKGIRLLRVVPHEN